MLSCPGVVLRLRACTAASSSAKVMGASSCGLGLPVYCGGPTGCDEGGGMYMERRVSHRAVGES